MTGTLLGVVLLVVSLAPAGIWVPWYLARRPRRGTALVRVPAEVVYQRPFALWTIRYPLPDGTSSRKLYALRTIPERLHKGMAVAVLVDPDEPTRARLDLPERGRFIRRLLIAVAASFAVGVLVFALAAVLISLV